MNDFFDEFTMVCLSIFGAGITFILFQTFLFAKDKESGNSWSNTFAPMNKKPDKYEVVFAADKIKFIRKDGKMSYYSLNKDTLNEYLELTKNKSNPLIVMRLAVIIQAWANIK